MLAANRFTSSEEMVGKGKGRRRLGRRREKIGRRKWLIGGGKE